MATFSDMRCRQIRTYSFSNCTFLRTAYEIVPSRRSSSVSLRSTASPRGKRWCCRTGASHTKLSVLTKADNLNSNLPQCEKKAAKRPGCGVKRAQFPPQSVGTRRNHRTMVPGLSIPEGDTFNAFHMPYAVRQVPYREIFSWFWNVLPRQQVAPPLTVFCRAAALSILWLMSLSFT